MRRNHLSLAPPPPVQPPPLSLYLSFSFPFFFFPFSLTLLRFTLAHYYRRTVSYERRHYSAGWNSVVSRPRARAKAPFLLPSPLPRRVPPHTASFANTRHPLFVVTCRLFEFCLSLSDLGAFPLVFYNHLSSTRSIVLVERLSPFSSNTPANRVSLRLTLKFSLSLTKAPSLHRAPFVGRTLTPLASLCFHLSLTLYLLLSLKLLPPVSSKYLAETRVCLSSVFFSFACLLLSLFRVPTPLPSTTVDLLRFSPEEG